MVCDVDGGNEEIGRLRSNIEDEGRGRLYREPEGDNEGFTNRI